MHEFNVIINIFLFTEKAKIYPTFWWRVDQEMCLQPGKFKSAETQTAGLQSVWSVLLLYFQHYNLHKSDFLTIRTAYGDIDICTPDFNPN